MHFYSLLHIEESQNSAINVRVSNFKQQMMLYLKNALTLNNSLRRYNIKFSLITNNKELLVKYFEEATYSLNVIEVEMKDYIPKGLPFYSAHYKLDAFKYIANNTKEYAIFCDLDMIAVNEIPEILINCCNNGISLYYDITSQVIPAHSSSKIISDLSLLIGKPSEGRWSGGEFIAGKPIFFLKLFNVIEEILPLYLNNVSTLHHIGDEAYTSAALEILRMRGEYISDAGTLGIVQRYWCAEIKHKQAKFKYYDDVFLLHLPSSKDFLSRASQSDIIIKNFHLFYKYFLFTRKIKLITLIFKRVYIKLIR